MRAEILCVGTELLIGQVVNTNATFLSRELAALGIDVHWVVTVGDNFERLGQAIAEAASRADLVLLSGGLGPTEDDITIEAIARYLGEGLEERADVRQHIEELFRKRNRPMNPTNLKQALFPPSATPIPNPSGTAYGLYAERNGTQFMSFPGVPFELEVMWRSWARPRLTGSGVIQSVLLKYAGIGESDLASKVSTYFQGTNPTVAPYASNGEVHLRVTAKAASSEDAEALLAPTVAALSAITPYYYGRNEETLPSVVGKLLLEHKQTVALAESCTGGLLASRITDISGASNYLVGGLVVYATRLKTELAGVNADWLAAHGTVNREVAEELANGARVRLRADWGIGITGWASNGPDVPAGDAGLVWVAIAGPAGTEAEAHRFGEKTPREVIKYRATQVALDLLRRRLLI
jgi:nicotinamide-nucleotide amidase